MNYEQEDILLNGKDDLRIANGDFVLEKSLTQEVGILVRLNQGDLKSDPLLGPNVIQYEKSTQSINEIRRRIRIHLKRDAKDYRSLQEQIQLKHQIT